MKERKGVGLKPGIEMRARITEELKKAHRPLAVSEIASRLGAFKKTIYYHANLMADRGELIREQNEEVASLARGVRAHARFYRLPDET